MALLIEDVLLCTVALLIEDVLLSLLGFEFRATEFLPSVNSPWLAGVCPLAVFHFEAPCLKRCLLLEVLLQDSHRCPLIKVALRSCRRPISPSSASAMYSCEFTRHAVEP